MAKVTHTKAELLREVEELRKALSEKTALDDSAVRLTATALSEPAMVPVRNFSPNHLTYEYDFRGQKRVLELSPRGKKNTAMIPVEIWNNLERDTELIADGYVARTDKPITNPNIVDDVADLIKNLTPDEFEERLASITNQWTLFKIGAYLEPLEKKKGKFILATQAVRARIKEVTGIVISDDTEGMSGAATEDEKPKR